MFNSSEITVGLEIGTTKVCVMVGARNADGALSIIGIGQAKSTGVRKGEIVDPAKAKADVRAAVVEAEQMANVEIRTVWLGVTGNHIQGFNNRGVCTILSADRLIAEEDRQDALRTARVINLSADQGVIHAIRQNFLVNGQDGIINPVGMLGERVEVDVHVVHGKKNRLQTAIQVAKGLQLETEAVVFNGLASALAVLTREQKELGTLVIDLGGGTINYVVYANGVVRTTGVLAVGGDHITNDLSLGLKVPLGCAEQLKLEYGRALMDPACRGQTVTLPSEKGLEGKTLSLEHLQCIMAARIDETLGIIRDRLAGGNLLDYLRAGVVLCGGGARIPQLRAKAEEVFDLPVILGKTCAISGLASTLDQPEFAAAIGLVKFGAAKAKQRPPRGYFRMLRDIFSGN